MMYLLFIIIGFLSGSIMYSYIIPRKILNIDICLNSIDNNPGAFNSFANCGIAIGLICLVLDILKGMIPVFFATKFLDYNNVLFSLVIASPVLGHSLGVFNKFKGGKCIATSFGVLLGLINITYIVLLLAVLYIVFVALFRKKSNFLKSIFAYSFFAIISTIILFISNLHIIGLGCLAISGIVIFKHYYANIANKEKESFGDEEAIENI